MKYTFYSLIGLSMAFLPLVGFADEHERDPSGPDAVLGPLGELTSDVLTFINVYLIPLVFAISFLLFIWGVFKLLIAQGEKEESRKEGRTFILWGIIGLAVMVAAWGLVSLLLGTFGLEGDSAAPDLPYIPTEAGRDGS